MTAEPSAAKLSLDQLKAMVASAPFHAHVPIDIVAHDPATGAVTLTLRHEDFLTRLAGTGQFHGGAIASLVDTSATFALIAWLGHPVATIDLFLNYVRPAGGGDLTAVATPRRVGRSVAVADVEVSGADGKLVALGRGTLTIQSR